jgi:hypothetical protein
MNINNHRKKLKTYMEQLLVLNENQNATSNKKYKLQTHVK